MKRTNWNRSWTFTPGTVPMKRGESRPVDLPHDFMIESKRDPANLTRRDGAYYPGGIGWYAKKFTAPEEWRDKNVYVEFEGVYIQAATVSSLSENIAQKKPPRSTLSG